MRYILSLDPAYRFNIISIILDNTALIRIIERSIATARYGGSYLQRGK